MARLFKHMQHLQVWGRTWIFPLYLQLHHSSEGQMLSTLSQARSAIGSAGYLPDDRRALEFALATWDYLIFKRFHPLERQGGELLYRDCLAQLSRPAAGPVSKVMQAHQLITLYGLSSQQPFCSVGVKDIERLLAQVPERLRTNLLWFHVSTLGFQLRHMPFVEMAYQELISERSGWLDDRMWLRVNLMYLILDGRASRNDVIETIRRYEHEFHIREVRGLFLPELQRLGLVDNEVMNLLEQRERFLQTRKHMIPRATGAVIVGNELHPAAARRTELPQTAR